MHRNIVKLAAVKDALDRTIGKAPTTVKIGPTKPYEELFEGIATMSRAESRRARGVPDVSDDHAGPGQRAPVFEHLMAHLRVKRPGSGRARTRPDRVRADKAYSSRAIRTELRRRGITTVIPEPSDQIAHRKRRGPRGGRPPAFDAADYKWRNVIERGFNSVKQWRGLATRYDKLAITYRAAVVLRAITIWTAHLSDTP